METTHSIPANHGDTDTHAAIDQLGEKLGRLKTDIQEVVGLTRSLAGEKLSGMGRHAMQSGKAAVDGVSSTIETYPLRSALIAVGIGAALAYLLSRR